MEEIERNILLLQEDANRLVERSVRAEKRWKLWQHNSMRFLFLHKIIKSND